jgi:hypothetical protein
MADLLPEKFLVVAHFWLKLQAGLSICHAILDFAMEAGMLAISAQSAA